MSIEVRVPQLPESVADALLAKWHKKVGDAVSRDENLVDLETDKVMLEVPAPANGVLREIRIQSGATVKGGQVLAVIEAGAIAAAPATGISKLHNMQLQGFLDAALRSDTTEDSLRQTTRLKAPVVK